VATATAVALYEVRRQAWQSDREHRRLGRDASD
jgi:hypothetical protein